MTTKVCPVHHAELIGGPVEFYCEQGHHRVCAADLPHDVDLATHPLRHAA
jgi:hypothetical protein